MLKIFYLHFVILCIILSPGILAKFLDEVIEESSNPLVREKRVIDHHCHGQAVTLEEAPYVVYIKNNNNLHCVATILSRLTAITASRCVALDLLVYTVWSGAVYTNAGNMHNISGKKIHDHHPPGANTLMTDIALITVYPPFEYSSTTRAIDFHVGPLIAGVLGNIYGWATHLVMQRRVETQHNRRLKSITVSIMDHRRCQNTLRNHFPVTEEYFCTSHPHRQCGNADAGAPFVIDDHLVGIYIGAILPPTSNLTNSPDVFALVQHLEYRTWIMGNIVR